MTWPTATLGELTASTRPIAYGVLKPGDFFEEGIPLLRIVDIAGDVIARDGYHRITPELDREFARTRLRGGELVLSIQGTVGRAAIVPNALKGANISRTLAVIDPDDRLDKRFLRMYFKFRSSGPGYETTGSTRASLNIGTIRNMRIPLPQIAVQRRIVEILEGHLSRLDAASAELASARRRIHALRRRAFALSLDSEGERVRLNDLLELSIGGVWGGEPGSQEVDVDVLRVTELKAWGRIEPRTAARRSITARQLTGRRLQAGDLLLEKSGGGPKTPVGRVGLIEAVPRDAICANFMQLMRPDRGKVDPRFLHLWLNGFHMAGRTASMQTASTNIRNIKASEYLEVHVVVPDPREQRQIVAAAEDLLAQCTTLERVIEPAERRGVALRRAILAAAFRGELAGRDSDLDRAEELVDA